jgi:hypothetical protein
MNLKEKLSEIETRQGPEHSMFLRPHGAVVALSRIMESNVLPEDMVSELLESIKESSDDIDNLLWTVPQSRSFFRKMIVEYLNMVDPNDPKILDGFLCHFQEIPMPKGLRNTLAIHLHENSAGLASAFEIWSKLRRL